MKPLVMYLSSDSWESKVASVLTAAVFQACEEQGSCAVLLTGGRSAERLYKTWAERPEFMLFRNVNFYFGDERCVPPDHPDSIYGLTMRTLFQRGIPQGCTVSRMLAEKPDSVAAAKAYEQLLPSRPDLMLLSVGEDGHIASLFPNTTVLHETYKRVVSVCAPKLPHERLTVTPSVIAQTKNKFVMALGQEKADIFKQAQANPKDFASIPARLVLNATWFIDANQIK